MTLNNELRRLLADARPTDEIEQAAVRHGMIEFRRGALIKVAKGVTSTEELLRSVPAEYLGVDD
jgi:type II secretory ATPase GspE/PulE/Tfp pilus assembly ATPase PilB-like protein